MKISVALARELVSNVDRRILSLSPLEHAALSAFIEAREESESLGVALQAAHGRITNLERELSGARQSLAYYDNPDSERTA